MVTAKTLDTLSCTDFLCPQANTPHQITEDIIYIFRASCHPDGLVRACYVPSRRCVLLTCGICDRTVEEIAVDGQEHCSV